MDRQPAPQEPVSPWRRSVVGSASGDTLVMMARVPRRTGRATPVSPNTATTGHLTVDITTEEAEIPEEEDEVEVGAGAEVLETRTVLMASTNGAAHKPYNRAPDLRRNNHRQHRSLRSLKKLRLHLRPL